jgi:hypothetical protein
MLSNEQKFCYKEMMKYINQRIGTFIEKADRAHVYVAGGAIVSALSGIGIRDYDIYFETETLAKRYEKHLAQLSDPFSIGEFKYGKFSLTHIESGISFIIKLWGAPSEIIETFDFMHCKCYAYLNDKEPTLSDEVLSLINRKELEIWNPQHPHRTLMRAAKFINRGWNVSPDVWEDICTNSGFADLTTLRDDLRDFAS